MRGSIWTVAAIAVSLALLPALLDVPTGDQTAQTVIDLTSAIGPVLAMMFFVMVIAVLVSVFTSDGF